MDSLIQIVRGKQPAFYAAYMNHRRVIETGNSPLVLRALVTDASTHSGIRGVKATFAPLNGTANLTSDKTNKPMVKTTTAKGMFWVKNTPAGATWSRSPKPATGNKRCPLRSSIMNWLK